MDITYEGEQNRCFKVPHKIYGNLNIRHSETNALTVLWNVYQIFVYDDLSFESPKVFIPEFNVSNVIVCNNYLICLDDNGNIHLSPLKCKHSAQKRLKTSFQPREQGVLSIENFYQNAICIKYTSNNVYLGVYKVNTDFILDTEHRISFDGLGVSNLETKNWVFRTYPTTSSEYDQIKANYQQNETWKDHVIIIFSIDRRRVFSFLYSSKTSNECLLPIKLHTCPSEIVDAHIIKTNSIIILLSLAIGTLVKVSLEHKKNDIQVIHLNAGINKLVPFADGMLYTDGNAMWKSEEIFTESIKIKKCLMAHIKDFVIIRDKLLCTTFNNCIYLLPITDELFQELPQDKYCPASEVLSNDDCLAKIMKEVAKSNEIVKKIKEEERYLTILSLSNRYDVLDDVINYKVAVFETFADIPKEDLTLVENIHNYYSRDTFCFLVSVSVKPLVNKFTELLSSMFGNLMIHVTVSTRTSCVKTLCINVDGQLKKINLAMPILTKKLDLNCVSVEIKLITSISEVFTTSQSMWTVLHSKQFCLNSENFIKTKVPADHIFCAADEELADPIYQSTVCHFGHLYKFCKSTRQNIEWLMYVKLAEKYQEVINNDTYLHKHFTTKKADILLKQITSDEFLKSKREVVFEIGNDKVVLEIVNDGFTEPTLKVRCTNVEKAFHIRNFVSLLMNKSFTEFEPGKEFVDHGLYSTIEKFQRTIQEIMNRPYSNLEFMKVFEKYQIGVIGKLPI